MRNLAKELFEDVFENRGSFYNLGDVRPTSVCLVSPLLRKRVLRISLLFSLKILVILLKYY